MLLDIGIKAESISRLFLKQVSLQLKKRKVKDLNPVQAVILMKIGKQEISVGDLEHRGFYLGSNPHYNLEALVSNGYLDRFQEITDGRIRIIKATSKGLDLYNELSPLFNINTAVTQDFYDWLCGLETFVGKFSQLQADHTIQERTRYE